MPSRVFSTVLFVTVASDELLGDFEIGERVQVTIEDAGDGGYEVTVIDRLLTDAVREDEAVTP